MRWLLTYVFLIVFILSSVIWMEPGTARIVWHDYVIDTSAAFLCVCALTAGYVFYTLLRLWYFLRHGPERWRLRRKLKKTHQGFDHITDGFIAVASGDASLAGYEAVRARKLLGTTPLTQLLQAQAAQLAGDHSAAREIFRNLASSPDSLTLGYRGLIMEARRDGNWDEVAHLAEKLRESKPNTPWLNLIRFELLARKHLWAEASLALSQVSASGLLEQTQSKQCRSALLVASSCEESRNNNHETALQSAEKAVKHAPHWLPAIINLAHCQLMSGHKRAARRTIERQWELSPHPQLAAIYSSLAEDPMDAYKDLQRLCRNNEDVAFCHAVLAEGAIAAQIWGEARRHLMALVAGGNVTQSTYRLMALLEQREHNDHQAASRWLIKVIDAAADPVWLCHSCGGTEPTWQATCSHCFGFNTLEWRNTGTHTSSHKSPSLLTEGWAEPL